MKKIWEIRRNSTQRCGKCFRAFKKGDKQFKVDELKGLRFSTVGTCCNKLEFKV